MKRIYYVQSRYEPEDGLQCPSIDTDAFATIYWKLDLWPMSLIIADQEKQMNKWTDEKR